ncbi:MAG: hypothetical protein N3E52_00350 [Candidatus Bathyarchaeota archaeon]|nr:hypothetical protein [Candidatus Bathyarchaeota archaeon]
MLSHSAITKLKTILIIDLIIVASAAGAYFYLQAEGLIASPPKPAEFVVTGLRITPSEVEIFEPVLVTVNVTNIGDEKGEYIANLTINGVIEENQTVTVLGKNFTIAEFTVLKETEGIYTVEIGGLTGVLTVKTPPPTASKIGLSKLTISPYEAWPNETMKATVVATNTGDAPDSLAVRFMVDGSLLERRLIELTAKETRTIEFTFPAPAEGKHTVQVNSLTGTFTVVPTGYHTLIVGRSGGGSKPLEFTLNGVPQKTTYVELLPVGEYTITVPKIVDVGTGILEFSFWSDGSTSTTITFKLNERKVIVATYTVISGYASCPSLFYWNGTDYVYVTEISNAGWLGYIDYIDEKGNIVFGGGNPWDTIKLDAKQLAIKRDKDGEFYDIILLQKWDEIFYLDTAFMLVVDHPADVDVYSTMVNYVNKAFPSEIYTVSKNNLLTPISAVNEKGENVLPYIAKLDGIFTPATNGLESPSWDKIQLNQLTLNLGDLSGAKEIKLVLNGMVDWGSPETYEPWIEQFKAAAAKGLVPNGTEIYPPPYMEVMDAKGNWVRVPQDRQIPIPSDYVPRTFAVNLTGLFPAGVRDYKIRITNFFNVTFDYIGIDITPQRAITVQKINAIAVLDQAFQSLSTSTGAFTRYGDVTQLILNEDDMFVIGRQGDNVSLRFPTANLAPLGKGMERSYFLFVACWFKDPPGNWGYGFNFTVEPLPFRNMTGFPYPATESYPYDEAHLKYLREYNTRVVKAPAESLTVGAFDIWAISVAILIAVVDLGVLAYFKKRQR